MINFNINIRYKPIPNKPEKMRQIAERTVAYAADRLEIEAKALCPVDTGRLQGSIHQGAITNGRSVGPDTPYDIYVEYGTSRHPSPNPSPRGYMRGGIHNVRKIISGFMVRRYREVMRA